MFTAPSATVSALGPSGRSLHPEFAPVEVVTPGAARSEMAPVAPGSALASSAGVLPVAEDPVFPAAAPWSLEEVE